MIQFSFPSQPIDSPTEQPLNRPVRLLLVDDQPFAIQLLTSYFETASNLEIVGSSLEGQAVLALVARTHPDLVLLDIEMPDIDGLTLTRLITEKFKETKVLVLSSHDQHLYIKKALEAGAQGYLLKGTPAEELILAVQFIYQGYLHLGPGLFEKLETYSKSVKADSNTLVQDSTAVSAESQVINTIEVSQTDRMVRRTPDLNAAPNRLSNAIQTRLDTLPKVWSRGLLYCLILFSAIAIPWAMVSKVDETGVARGRLEPQGNTLRLESPIAGRVSVVKVREGDMVAKGQVLLELEADAIRTSLKQSQTRLDGQIHQLRQLKFLKNQVLNSVSVQTLQNQAQLLEKSAQINQAQDAVGASRDTIALQLAEKQTQIDQAIAAIQFAQAALHSSRDRYTKDLAEVQRYRSLEEKGVVSEVQVVEAERLADDSKQRRDQNQADLKQAQQRLDEQKQTYERLKHQLSADYQQTESQLQEQKQGKEGLYHGGELTLLKSQEQLNQLDSDLAVLNADIQQTKEDIKSFELQLEKHIVRSPIQGVIFQLPIKKAEAYLEPGGMIAQIAPEGLPLILKAKMPNTESGFTQVGMPVKLKFDAYPFQDYGVVSGTVTWISPDSKTDPLSQNSTEFFELEITLKQLSIQNATQTIPLTSGQTASAEVIIRQRRIIDFILDPFKQLQKDGIKL